MGLHAILFRGPVDSIKSIRFNSLVAWSGDVTTSQEITINKPNLFGGQEKEGGVAGKVDILMGEDTQGKNAYLQSKIGPVVPAFRGVVSLIFKSFYFSAMTPYFKQPAVEAVRIPLKTWNSSIANINGSANPIHAVLEMHIHPDWGMGYALDNAETAELTQAAQTLYDEGFGVSFSIKSEDDYEKIIEMLMNHINGVYRVNRNGKFTVKLLRGDYLDDIASLPLFNETNCEKASFERPSYAELVNRVTVKYRPQGALKDDSVTVSNTAAIQNQGAVVTQVVNYPAIDNVNTAMLAAQRDLRLKSTPLARLKLRNVNRMAWNLSVGDVFRYSWERDGIDELIFRIIKINYGSLEDGSISIEAVEDIFGLPYADYIVDQASMWNNPNGIPDDIVLPIIQEMSYWEFIQRNGEDTTYLIDNPGSAFLTAAAGKQSFGGQSFELWTQTGKSDDVIAHDPEYPLYDLYLEVGIGPTDTVLGIRDIDTSHFYWLTAGTEITITDYVNTETLTVVSISSSSITVQARTGNTFGVGAYIFPGYPDNARNPIGIGHDLSAGATSISSWMYATDSSYVVPGEYYLIDNEFIRIVSGGSGLSAAVIARAQLGSVATTHKAGHFMRRIYNNTSTNTAWEKRASTIYSPELKVLKATSRAETNLFNILHSIEPTFVRLGSYAYWDGEIVRIDRLEKGYCTIGRGCLDTVPIEHSANSNIYFIEDNTAASDYQYLDGETVSTKLLSRTSDLLDLDSATTHNLTMVGRLELPYPPGNVKANGTAYPETISNVVAALTWSHRDRLLQTHEIIDTTYGNVGPEAGTTYSLSIYGEDSLLIRTITTSATSYTFSDELTYCDLWDETDPDTTKINESGESSLTGWACANEISGGFRGKLLTYNGTSFVAQKQSYSAGPGIVITSQCLLTSSSANVWAEVATVSTPSGLNLGDIRWLAYGSGIYIGECDGVTAFIYSTDLANWSQNLIPSGMGVITKAAWTGTEFVIVSVDSGVIKSWTSTDGLAWTHSGTLTDPSVSFGSNNSAIFLGYFGGTYYALVDYNTTAPAVHQALYSSTDAITWSEIYNSASAPGGSPTQLVANMVECGGTYLVGASYAGINPGVIRSTDGITFTEKFVTSGLTIPNSKLNNLFTDGTDFFAVTNDNNLLTSSDGLTWTVSGVFNNDELIEVSNPENQMYAAGRYLVGWREYFVNSRLISESADAVSWGVSYPSPPTIARITSDSHFGVGCLEMSSTTGLPGYCFKDFTNGLDIDTQKVFLNSSVKGSTGQTPTLYVMTKQTGSEIGYGFKLDIAGNQVLAYKNQDGAVSVIATISTSLSVDTWYSVELSVVRNKKVTLKLYNSAGTLIAQQANIAFTGLTEGSSLSEGFVKVASPGKYDNLIAGFQQHWPRYNDELRFVLKSVRDSKDSYQSHDFTVTRPVTRA